jgi:hypothetical protein
MRRLVPLLTVVVASALGASSASAQACVGLPSFEGRPFRINAAAEFPEDAKAYAIGLGVGRANGPFLNAGAWQASYDGISEKATIGFAEVGWQIPLGPAQLCPLAGGTYGTGPDDELNDEEVSSWSAIGGAAIGYPVAAGPVQLIPNGGFRFEHLSYTIKSPFFEEDFSDTADSKVIDLGLALVLANRFSVQPLVHIPVGSEDEDSKASFGVFLSVALP